MLKADNEVLLIVDDNEEVVEFLVDDLKDDYDVIACHHAGEAIEKLKHHPVHLIISDVMMPEITGFELCNIIKSDVEHSHIPIILLTVKNTIQSKIEGLNSGADAYVEKPFSPQYLKAQIKSLLNNRNKIKEHFAKSPLAHLTTIAHTKTDEEFLKKLHSCIMENIEDMALGVDQLALNMNMSRPTLYRKIKSMSNLSPNEIINITRLNLAAEMISKADTKLYEIADKVGYRSLTQLGRNFQKQFNMSPSEYSKKLKSLQAVS